MTGRVKLCESTDSVSWQELKFIFDNSPMGGRNVAALELAFKNSDVTCFAYEEDRLIGCGRALTDEVYQAALYDICVDHSYRQRGIGQLIVGHLIGRIKAQNIILYTVPGVEIFYEKMGFHRLKTGMAFFRPDDKAIERGYVE